MFLVAGAGKAEKVRAILGGAGPEHPPAAPRAGSKISGPQDLPAAQVRPRQGQLLWLLDRAAAAVIT